MLSNGYRFEILSQNEVYCRPCCKWEDKGPTVLVKGSPEELSKKLIEHRELIGNIDSYKSNHCKQCNHAESSGVNDTMRTSSFKDIPVSAEFGDPTFLEIQLNRTCNAACIMCGPNFSSLWQQELRKAGQDVGIDKPEFNSIYKIISSIDLQKVRKLNILGGESLVTDSDFIILPKINNPELVRVQYSTNGSIYPGEDRMALWSKFKRVELGLSIDGIGERFEYIRYPLKWAKVKDNIQRMRDSASENMKFYVAHTINLFNIFYYDEIEQWCKDVELDLVPNIAWGLHSPLHLTDSLYELLLEKYGEGSFITRIVKNTNLYTDPIMEFTNTLDERRGLDWKKVFPEISECFE
jgi:MoaA/NifB/PqqE/SkfB family radical SAM enzyme